MNNARLREELFISVRIKKEKKNDSHSYATRGFSALYSGPICKVQREVIGANNGFKTLAVF
jgi:hypothetical protein